ncbi:MAG TPA: hypothetical protein VFU54_13705 [Actinomycetota bacterium]|nr:hypothetical protein [Actinomycetota bacterium]
MRAWCPRCDADRPGETTCPVCGTPLAILEASRPAPEPDAPPPTHEPVQPPAPSRLRVALLVAVLVLGGLAFVAGHSGTRPVPPAAPATTTPATTAPESDNLRQLGWRAGPNHGVTVTAVSIRRIVTPDRETSAELTLRVEGLPTGQRLFALRGLRLLDVGGGVFSTPEEEEIGDQAGTPATPTGDPATYTIVTAPAPRLQTLAKVEVGGLIVARPRTARIELDVGGPWPARPPLRSADPGSRDTVTVAVPRGSVLGVGGRLPLRLAAVLVGGGRAVVALDAREAFQGVPGGTLPVGAELRAGDRVLCSRTVVLRGGDIRTMFGMVLACPTQRVPRLTVAVGAGVQALPLDVALEQ